jgi:hypothetical protein
MKHSLEDGAAAFPWAGKLRCLRGRKREVFYNLGLAHRANYFAIEHAKPQVSLEIPLAGIEPAVGWIGWP